VALIKEVVWLSDSLPSLCKLSVIIFGEGCFERRGASTLILAKAHEVKDKANNFLS
jgi:hypothetical protein